jgi:ribonuclease P protein component
MGEAHVSTQQPQAQAQARIPSPDANAGRSGGPAPSPGPWPQPPVGLIWSVRGRADFARLARAPRRRHDQLVVSFVMSNDLAAPPSVAYAVGRAAGGAVTRNRLRRRLRSAVRESAEDLVGGGLYLFACRPGAAAMPYRALRRAVRGLLHEIRVETVR